MSWSTFHVECMALTGQKHVSRTQFAARMSGAYHNCMLRHFDSMTAGGTAITIAAMQPILFQGFLTICEQNLNQHNGVNWAQQIGNYVIQYWTGAVIVGPIGIVNVTYPGSWIAPYVPQNLDFNLILYSIEAAARVHLATMLGIYTSTVTTPPVTTPWSGAMLQTFP